MLEAPALRSAVAQLAADVAADTCSGVAHKAGDVGAALDTEVTEGQDGAALLPNLCFAVAWRSRSAAEHTCTASTGERAAAPAQRLERAIDEPANGSGAAAEGDCSVPEDRGFEGKEGGRTSSGKAAIAGSSGALSRGAVLAAAASGFAEGFAGVRTAVVDLQQPEWVLLVEGVPVSRQVLCALSIVSAKLTSLKPKLQILAVGV